MKYFHFLPDIFEGTWCQMTNWQDDKFPVNFIEGSHISEQSIDDGDNNNKEYKLN